MRYFSHMKRDDCLEKDIYKGIIQGKCGLGRHRRKGARTPSKRLGAVHKIELLSDKLSKTLCALEHNHLEEELRYLNAPADRNHGARYFW